MIMFVKIVLIVSLSCLPCYLSFQDDWELKQFSTFGSKLYYESSDFNTTEDVIQEDRRRVKQWMSAERVPGAVFGLSIKGKTVWTEAFGQIDIENNVTTTKTSLWRLASISKTMTSSLVALLTERGLIDLNKSIHDYVSEDLFPRKTFFGKPVNITVRQLLSHTAGLRSLQLPEDFSKVIRASNISQSIAGLKNDRLLLRPGAHFLYSNYGFQLVGAIIESVLNNSFPNEIRKMFVSLGMNSSFPDIRGRIHRNRPRYYQLSKNGNETVLQNADILDDLAVYEGWWAMGGLMSTVEDMLTFGNAWLSSYKGRNDSIFVLFLMSFELIILKILFRFPEEGNG